MSYDFSCARILRYLPQQNGKSRTAIAVSCAHLDFGNVDIVGQPHTVPHGGIAIDARICNGNNYSINCFETYGTDELLSDLESILTKENVSFAAKSDYMKMMKKGMHRKSMMYAATVRVVPLEVECVARLLQLAGNQDHLGALLFLRLMKENGELLTLWDLKESGFH